MTIYIVVGRGPLPGPETELLSNTQKWIVQGDTCWQSKKFYWGRAPGWRTVGWGNPGDLLCHVAGSLGFYGDCISFQVIFSQLFWLRVLPGGACIVQPRWMPARRILWGGQTCGVSFWPFLNSPGWWCLISSVFLTRTLCKWLLWCLARVGSFSQSASPNMHIFFTDWKIIG